MPANLENSAVSTGLEKISFHCNPKEKERKVAQSCPTLCDPMDCSLSGSLINGIFQVRVLERVAISFYNPKERQCQRMLNYHTIALISHASKVMLKILQAGFQQYMNRELPDVQAGFRKGRGTRDQIANIHWIIKKAREFQNTSALLTVPVPLTVWITTNWKILKEMGIPDHLTCLLRNLYAGQAATVKTGPRKQTGSK